MLLLAAVWLAGAIYSALCLWEPGMRPYHRLGFLTSDEEAKFGPVTCVGMAMVFWLPALVYVGQGVGLVPFQSPLAVYAAPCLGIFVAVIGSLLDIFVEG